MRYSTRVLSRHISRSSPRYDFLLLSLSQFLTVLSHFTWYLFSTDGQRTKAKTKLRDPRLVHEWRSKVKHFLCHLGEPTRTTKIRCRDFMFTDPLLCDLPRSRRASWLIDFLNTRCALGRYCSRLNRMHDWPSSRLGTRGYSIGFCADEEDFSADVVIWMKDRLLLNDCFILFKRYDSKARTFKMVKGCETELLRRRNVRSVAYIHMLMRTSFSEICRCNSSSKKPEHLAEGDYFGPLLHSLELFQTVITRCCKCQRFNKEKDYSILRWSGNAGTCTSLRQFRC